jgi:hypothetical protein
MNASYNTATAAILLNSSGFSLPPNAVRYINLAATGSALAFKFPGIEISADGTIVKFAGELLGATAHESIVFPRMGIGDDGYGMEWMMVSSQQAAIRGFLNGDLILFAPDLILQSSPTARLSFFGHTTAVRQTAAADATDLASAITLINGLKSILKDDYGLIG